MSETKNVQDAVHEPEQPGKAGRRYAGKAVLLILLAAARDAFEAGYERAAIVGTDIPHMRPDSIRRAFDLLAEADVVLGPTPDGGYWLIGLKRAIPELFDISAPWGSGGVRLGTLERARELGCICAETDSYRDLDTPDDLRAFLEERRPYGSATRACLEGLLGGRVV